MTGSSTSLALLAAYLLNRISVETFLLFFSVTLTYACLYYREAFQQCPYCSRYALDRERLGFYSPEPGCRDSDSNYGATCRGCNAHVYYYEGQFYDYKEFFNDDLGEPDSDEFHFNRFDFG